MRLRRPPFSARSCWRAYACHHKRLFQSLETIRYLYSEKRRAHLLLHSAGGRLVLVRSEWLHRSARSTIRCALLRILGSKPVQSMLTFFAQHLSAQCRKRHGRLCRAGNSLRPKSASDKDQLNEQRVKLVLNHNFERFFMNKCPSMCALLLSWTV
jgi:hypothetical protein